MVGFQYNVPSYTPKIYSESVVKTNRGDEVEDVVEEACSTAFLSDFVVRNPEFRKESGQLKEAADFLIPFDSSLLAFQVKSKIEEKPGSHKTEVDFARIQKRIDKGIAQLNTVKRAIAANQIKSLKNARGIEIPFAAITAGSTIGVVILDLIGEEKLPEAERTALYGGYTYEHDMPIHIFRLSDYREIVSEIDTLPDFIDYLSARRQLYEKNMLGPLTEELDFLAVYKTQPELIEQCYTGKCDLLVINEGTWDGYISDHDDARKKRDELNKPSRLIDGVIAHLHESIGHNPSLLSELTNTKEDQGTIENYFVAITELSKLDRLTRRAVGQKLLEKMRKADKTGDAYGLVVNEVENSAILVLSSNRSQQERANGMYNFCSIAYCKYGLTKIIGISTDPLSAPGRSYEAIVLEDVHFENPAKIADKFESVFGPTSRYRDYEYGSEESKD